MADFIIQKVSWGKGGKSEGGEFRDIWRWWLPFILILIFIFFIFFYFFVF